MSTTITKSDFSKICRICLKEDEKKISIFQSDILSTLQQLTSINVQMKDNLPNEICTNCEIQIFKCAQFIKLCTDSQRLLTQIRDDNENKSWFVVTPTSTTVQTIKIETTCTGSCSTADGQITNDADSHDLNSNNDHDANDNILIKNEEDIQLATCTDAGYVGAGVRKLSQRKARINWVLSLSADQCDTSKLLCTLCDKTLVNLSSLARHMETHDKNRKVLIVCKICRKGFYEKSNYLKHMQRHQRLMKYKCDHCCKSFYELNILSKHLQKQHQIEPIQCTECTKTFIIRTQYDLHWKSKHLKQHEYKCTVCDKGYNLKYRLQSHLLTHQRQYHCKQCNKYYKNYSSLKSHHDRYHHVSSNHHPSLQQRHPQSCPVCGKLVKHLKQHMRLHGTERPFECDQCCKTFLRRCDMIAHLQRKHNQHQDQDNKMMTTAPIPPPAPAPYLCNICGQCKLSNSALQQHIIHAHTTEKTCKCALCEKYFKTDNALRGHIRYIHKDVRNYQCTVCTKSFYTNAILRNHERTHTGERPYQCPVCARAFVQRSTLRTHMKVHVVMSTIADSTPPNS